jgi:hypothetical protein
MFNNHLRKEISMSFQNVNLTGEAETVETVTVQVTKGDFNEISLDCGKDKIVLKGHIKEVQRTLGVSTVVAFRVEEPGKAAYEITSEDSPRLYNDDGTDREVPRDTVVTPVPGGKAF